MVVLISTIIVFLDQLSKFLVVNFLKGSNAIVVVPDFLSLVYLENQGAAFEIFKGCTVLFIVVTVLMLVASVFAFKNTQSKFLKLTISMFIGGGIGNFIDRVFRGYVVDFISLSFFSPVFNFADVFITISAVFFIFYMFKNREQKSSTNFFDGGLFGTFNL